MSACWLTVAVTRMARFVRLLPLQRSTLLVHELAHLKRRDHLARMVELAALCLYWWHPVAWWARRNAERAAEHCCDAEVVAHLPNAARAYAAAMVTTVDFLSEATKTNYNRKLAAERQLAAVKEAFEADTVTLDQLLEAQRRTVEVMGIKQIINQILLFRIY